MGKWSVLCHKRGMNPILKSFFESEAKRSHIGGAAKLLIELLATQKAGPPVVIVTRSDDFLGRLRNLRFFAQFSGQSLATLPSDDFSLYHKAATDPLVAMEQMKTLFSIAMGDLPDILLVSAKSLLKKVPTAKDLTKHATMLAAHEKVSRDDLIKSFLRLGYVRVNQVLDKGTFATRGSVIDIFATNHNEPIRIDLFGDEIEHLCHFDPDSQRNGKKISDAIIGGAKEIFFDDDTKNLAEERLTKLADEIDYGTAKLNEKLSDIENGIYFYGIEKLKPGFFLSLTTPLELILNTSSNQQPLIFFDDLDAIMAELTDFYEELRPLHAESVIRHDLVFDIDTCYASPDFVKTQFDSFNTTNFSLIAKESHGFLSHDVTVREQILQSSMAAKHDSGHPLLAPLANQIRALHQNKFAVAISLSSGEHETELRQLIQPLGINLSPLKKINDITDLTYSPHIHAYTLRSRLPLYSGGIFDFLKIALISEDDIFGSRTKKAQIGGKQKGFQTALGDLNIDDFVVHVDHGIGQFKGIVRLNFRGVDNDYVLLVYQNQEKLYLPTHKINLIKPYQMASAEGVRLDKLGGTVWVSKKKKVKEAVLAMAQGLLTLYAKRELVERPPSLAPDAHYFEFESAFAFEPTPDQAKAFDDVIGDMQKKRPMDRLICGDVGYGKTEVAMRAAMLAVINRRQVAVLAPTTVLAQQHGITFTERFKNTGVNIAVISRFQKSSEIKGIIEGIKKHQIDIVIGTHRILSNDVEFSNLGLMVVDEEQRFGIKAKEHLKKLKTKTDVLAMSATPIPRTLQMSFFGIRDLSVIDTPPVDRRAIQTSIVEFDDALIKEAILREINRGGQVYFVHNRVSSIEATASYIKALVPQARVAFAHGQMSEDILEAEMVRFMNHDINVLVCTTIIETGIDVATANTMFINNADDFGLSQLYQLRGRIGRSKERAFAYLLIKGQQENLTDIARKRLEVLHRFSNLGAGFHIAKADLELRGAGDLLGQNQHGHMAAVGYDLYADLLKEAVHHLQGRPDDEHFEPEVTLPVSALISEKFCPDLHERMSLYQRLAAAESLGDVESIFFEIEDVFGILNEEMAALKICTELKIRLKALRALKLDITHKPDSHELVVGITLTKESPVDEEKIKTAVASGRAHITPQQKILKIFKYEGDLLSALKRVGNEAVDWVEKEILL